MYSDHPENKRPWLLPLLAGVILALAVSLFAALHPAASLDEGGAAAIREAVQRGALQCYAVEGVYPPDLQYLEENYGLQVNTRDFYVTYEAFASNLPPTIRVTAKAGA